MNLGDYLHGLETEIELVIRKFMGQSAPTRRERMRRAAEIKHLVAEVQKVIPAESKKLVKMEYNNGAHRALTKVPDLRLFEPDKTTFSDINRETVNALADNLKNDLHTATIQVGRRSEDVLRRHGLSQSTISALQNLPDKYQAMVLRRKLERAGITGFVDSAGRKWKLSTYADMVIRTTTSEAQNRAVANSVLGRGLDLVRVDEHKHPNDVCSPYDGKVFSLTGRTPGYPVLEIIPPFHPNCKHSILPARENFTDPLARVAYDERVAA